MQVFGGDCARKLGNTLENVASRIAWYWIKWPDVTEVLFDKKVSLKVIREFLRLPYSQKWYMDLNVSQLIKNKTQKYKWKCHGGWVILPRLTELGMNSQEKVRN